MSDIPNLTLPLTRCKQKTGSTAPALSSFFPFHKYKIDSKIRMSIRAVAFFCINCGGRFASQYINTPSNWLKMSRIYTKSNSAQMVQLKALFYKTHMKLIRESMSKEVSPIRFINSISAIKNVHTLARPEPTPGPKPALFRFVNMVHKKVAVPLAYFSIHAEPLLNIGALCKTP